MSFADNIKAKIKDVDLESQLTSLVDEGEQLVQGGLSKAGDLAHGKRDDIDGWLGKATEAINGKTEGKYADQLTKLRTTLLSGVEKVAEHRGDAGAGDGAAEPGEPIELAAPDDAADPLVDAAASADSPTVDSASADAAPDEAASDDTDPPASGPIP